MFDDLYDLEETALSSAYADARALVDDVPVRP